MAPCTSPLEKKKVNRPPHKVFNKVTLFCHCSADKDLKDEASSLKLGACEEKAFKLQTTTHAPQQMDSDLNRETICRAS